ncbi:hypothetical protein NVP1187O_101 [Vibrio phage 1.187.O._10N.286.49.F1]|nr:hypothetical protein NVP1187O_101 [Vibrio phage 1.187.O._10N.286.49.F1]
MFKFLEDYKPKCDYCRLEFLEGEEEESTGWGFFHVKCKDAGVKEAKEDYHQSQVEYFQEQLRQQKRDEKLLRKLRKRIPSKIMEWVDGEISGHGKGDYKVVTVDQCKGDRMRGKDYYCDDKCPIRTIYDYISSGGYPCDDGYSGEIYIYIGNGQYFNMWVGG